jgi:hypothetical protein
LSAFFAYEAEGVATMIAGAGKGSPYVGRRWTFPTDDPSVIASLQRTGRPISVDDYTQVEGAVTAEARELGIYRSSRSSGHCQRPDLGLVGTGEGARSPTIARRYPRPPGSLYDLMATAIANSDARTEFERLAEEQAALRRVATLVAQGEPTEEVFAAVAREVSE